MRRNWQHTGKPTQPVRPKRNDKQGKAYKPVQIPVPNKRDVLGPLARAARGRPAPDQTEDHGQGPEDQ
jgi:hypothetical protein